jgi:hypothetical protein
LRCAAAPGKSGVRPGLKLKPISKVEKAMLRLSWNFLLRSAVALGILGTAVGAAALSAAVAAPLAPETHPRGTSVHLADHYGRLPLSFEVNRGQAERSVRFLAHGQGYGLYLTADGAVLTLHKPDSGATAPRSRRMARLGHSPEILGAPSPRKNTPGNRPGAEPATAATDVVRMQLAGANAELHPAGLEPLPGTANYILGNDPAKWQTGVSTYARVRYAGVYPGVDLVYYGNQRQLEYDFVVAPGADPKPIQLHFDGAKALRLDGAGNLVIAAANGEVAFEKPAVYQLAGGIRQPIEGRFQLLGDSTAGFALGSYDRTKPLVIDPVLSYATYLGGSTEDFAISVAVDAAGEAYVTGLTWSVDFPLTPGAVEAVNQATSANGVSTAFICKLNASGTALLYSTYLGGVAVADTEYGQGDYSHSIAVDSAGNAYVTGWTYSANFPVTNGAFQTANNAIPTSEATGFVTKLNANGTGLLYSTYLGGSTLDEPTSIALDSSGNVYTAGFTFSTDYPTSSSAFQTGNNSPNGWNAFVSKLNSTGTALTYSTYLGGSGENGSMVDGNYALIQVAVDKNGNAYVAGFAQSADFPVTAGVLQIHNNASTNEGTNLTLSKLNSTGTGLLYSTFLGGSSYPGDFSEGLAVDSSGNAYVTGYTYSSDFPVTGGAFQSTNKGAVNSTTTAFATKINSTATALGYSTYLGGSAGDDAYGLALDGAGDLFLTGTTMSSDFPVTAGAFQSTIGSASGGANAFLTELNPTGTGTLYSTYLGGSGLDRGYQVALGNGEVFLTGSTSSSDFPVTTAAYDTVYSSAYNTAFVAGFNLGTATPPKPTVTTLTASANPQLIGNTVTFTATVAPVSGTGIPAGSLVFSIDENSAATVTLDGTGKATYSTSALAGGQHYVLASYAGSSTYASSGNGLIETITLPVTTAPILSPGTGTYSLAQLVTMTDGTAGAVIYYTTDGSTPTVSSATYSTPITVSSTETVQAVAAASNYALSPVTTATYTITYAASELSLSPVSATAGGTGFTLTVNGANFTSKSVVLWNGAMRATTFVSSTQLTAAILTADIAKEATNLITVANLAPNPWTSAALPFVVMGTAPVATIKGDSISNAADGSGNHVLSLTGSDFIPASTVRWNGTNLATNYVSPWQATATITANEYTTRPAAVTVNNTAGTSPVFELR